MESFNFVFIMKMMLKLFRITNELSQCLPRRDQNIVQAMSLLVDVKARLVDLRSNGWEELFDEVQAFCDAKKIEIPSMDAPRPRWGRSRQEKEIMVTEEHHYRVDTFYAVVDAIMKRPLIREDLKVIQYQSQEADNTFITLDGTSPYNSTRKWAVKRHYREDDN